MSIKQDAMWLVWIPYDSIDWVNPTPQHRIKYEAQRTRALALIDDGCCGTCGEEANVLSDGWMYCANGYVHGRRQVFRRWNDGAIFSVWK